MLRSVLLGCIATLPFLANAGLGFDSACADVVLVNQIQFVGTATESQANETNLINGSGLVGNVATEADFLTVEHQSFNPNRSWSTDAPGGNRSDYFSSNPGTIVFDLTLSGTYTLTSFANWGYHSNRENGDSASEAVLQFSTDGGQTFDSTQTVGIALTTKLASVGALAPVNANFVRLQFADNHFESARGGDRLGVSEIRFGGILSVVPEPSSALSFFGALLLLSGRLCRNESPLARIR